MRKELLLEIAEAVEIAQRQIRKAHETWNRNQKFLEENYSETDEEQSKCFRCLAEHFLKIPFKG